MRAAGGILSRILGQHHNALFCGLLVILRVENRALAAYFFAPLPVLC